MDPRDKQRLQRQYANLLDVIYSSIAPHLISNFILTLEMHDEIDSRPTERKKMEKLLSILPSRGGNAMNELIKALRTSYQWIARELENEGHGQCVYPNFQNNNNILNNLPETSIAKHVREISRILQEYPRACTHWTFLAHSMGLSASTEMDIKKDMSFSGGHEYAIFAVLDAWVTKVGASRATFSELISILDKEGMNSCGEDVMAYLYRLPRRVHPANPNIAQQEGRQHPLRTQSPI